jgi:hypothetical protein
MQRGALPGVAQAITAKIVSLVSYRSASILECPLGPKSGHSVISIVIEIILDRREYFDNY